MDNRYVGPRGRRFNDKMTSSELVFVGLGCAVAALLAAVIQTSFFFNFRPFGFAPDLCLALTVVSGLLFGAKCGGVVGLLALPESGLSLAKFPLYLLSVAAGGSVYAIAFVFWSCITYSSFNIADIIFKTALPELISTLVFSVAVYPLGMLVLKFIKKKQGISIK